MNPYSIMVSSTKGGVGKTTIAVNLATALQMRGYKTVLVAGDNQTPFVFNPKDIKQPKMDIMSWVNRISELPDVISVHNPTGLHILCDYKYGEARPVPDQVALTKLLGSLIVNTDYFYDQFSEQKYSFIVIDTRPGYNMYELSHKTSEALLITKPDAPSIAGISKIASEFGKLGVTCGIVVNEVKGASYEMKADQIKTEYGIKIISYLPDDDIVPESAKEGIPAVMLGKDSRFSKEMISLAGRYYPVVEPKG